MGQEYSRRAPSSPKNLVLVTSTATLTDAVVTLPSEGIAFVTYGTSGNSNDAIIPTPDYKGAQLQVVLDNNTTSLEANFNTATTATGNDFFGSTFNTITANSTANETSSFSLVAVSTARWAITSLSVNATTAATHMDWVLAATTGSTGQ